MSVTTGKADLFIQTQSSQVFHVLAILASSRSGVRVDSFFVILGGACRRALRGLGYTRPGYHTEPSARICANGVKRCSWTEDAARWLMM